MIKNIICIGDTHFGHRLSMLSPNTVLSNMIVKPTTVQKKLYKMWRFFWDEVVPTATKGESYTIIHMGDIIEGTHHDSKGQISQIIDEQKQIALDLLTPEIQKAADGFYCVTGTPAHAGEEGDWEESTARELGATPDESGKYSRQELWMKLGDKYLCNFMHHISASDSSAAVEKELRSLVSEAGRWNLQIPDVVVRAHRHAAIGLWMPTYHGRATAFTTPSWQIPTSFAKKVAGARTATPQIGGSIIRYDEYNPYVLDKIWTIGRPKVEGVVK